MSPKQRAAEHALNHLSDGMVIGLGTGTTADFFLQALAQALRSGRLKEIMGVPTSRQSERRAKELAIPLIDLGINGPVDVTVDGADEIAPTLDLIKGLGGALLREKIVAQNSRALIIIADESKVVSRLGTRAPLPVEVSAFSHRIHESFLRSLGAVPALRVNTDAAPFVTDNGNYIYDCLFAGGIADPMALHAALRGRAGIIDSGLFLGLCRHAIVAGPDSVRELSR